MHLLWGNYAGITMVPDVKNAQKIKFHGFFALFCKQNITINTMYYVWLNEKWFQKW